MKVDRLDFFALKSSTMLPCGDLASLIPRLFLQVQTSTTSNMHVLLRMNGLWECEVMIWLLCCVDGFGLVWTPGLPNIQFLTLSIIACCKRSKTGSWKAWEQGYLPPRTGVQWTLTCPALSYLEYLVVRPRSLYILFNAHAAYGAK